MAAAAAAAASGLSDCREAERDMPVAGVADLDCLGQEKKYGNLFARFGAMLYAYIARKCLSNQRSRHSQKFAVHNFSKHVRKQIKKI